MFPLKLNPRKMLLCGAAFLHLATASAQGSAQRPELSDPRSWCVVMIPDPQGYMKNARNQPIFEMITSWIATNSERMNIKLAVCVGDIVEQNERICDGYSGDQSSASQWSAAARIMGHLDGVVPYIMATGNHDYTYSRTGEKRTEVDKYFPSDKNPLNRKFMCQYGLDQQSNHTMANSAFEIKAPDGRDYLFLNMEFAPRDTVVGWARAVVGLPQYKNHRIVLTTHEYINTKATRTSSPMRVTAYTPLVVDGKIKKYRQTLPDANAGEELWQKLVKPTPNIELVLCGHYAGWAFRSDKNDAGRDVHQMLFDAQSVGGGYEGNGGDGWIRILEFLPDGQTVNVTTFSPLFGCSPSTLDKAFMNDSKHRFSFRFSDK